jgi:hypothetical protein
MGWAEEADFIEREGLKTVETKNQKQIAHFKVIFLIK